MDVVLGRLGAGHKAGGNGEEERPTERVVILMHKVFQLPSGALCRLIALSLTLLILFVKPDQEWSLAMELIDITIRKKDTCLNAGLLSRCVSKVGLSDAFCNLEPQRTTQWEFCFEGAPREPICSISGKLQSTRSSDKS